VIQRTTEVSKAVKNPQARLHHNSPLNDELQLYCIAIRDGSWHFTIFMSNATQEQVGAVTSVPNWKIDLQSIPNWQNLTFETIHIVDEAGGNRNHHYYNDDGTIRWAQKKNEAPLGAKSWPTANRMAAAFFQRLGINVDVNALDVRANIAAPPTPPVVPQTFVPVNQLPPGMTPRSLRKQSNAPTPKLPSVVLPPPTPPPQYGPPLQVPPPQQQVLPPLQQQVFPPPQQLFPSLQQYFVPAQQPPPQQQAAPPISHHLQYGPLVGRGSYPYAPDEDVYAPQEMSSSFMETGDW